MMRKMSAMICMLLALAMAIGLFLLRMPMAYAETFSKMKDSIPETVSFTIDGESVEVPVILPEVDELPIGYLCPGEIDAKAMREIFGDGLTPGTGDSHLGIRVGSLWLEGVPSNSTRTWLDTEIAPGIELTPERAQAKFFELLEQSGLDLTFMPEKMLVRSGYVYVDEVWVDANEHRADLEEAGIPVEEFEDGYTKRVPNIDKPVEGLEAGYYVFVATQTHAGIPIYPIKSLTGKGCWFGPYVGLDIAGENDYSLRLAYISQPCGKGMEPDLAPFEKVVQAVQQRIDEGMLRSVDSIQLSYGQTNLLQNGQTIASKYADRDHPNGALVPIWKVNGYDRSQKKLAMRYGFEEPNAFVRRNTTLPDGFYLSYDATTGELWNRKGWEDE